MKFQSLQLYRAGAALLVVLFHLGINPIPGIPSVLGNLFSLGYVGVDYFFVLSGFIITYIHYNDIVRQTNLATYIKKRLTRIFPIYWIVATCTLLAAVIFSNGTIDLHENNIPIYSMQGIAYVIRCYLLIPKGGVDFFVIVAWTLSFELAFYFAFAVFIIAGKNFSYLLFFVWIVWIFLNNFIFHLHGPLNVLSNFYILQFLMGCVTAYLVLKKIFLPVYLLISLILVSFAAIIFEIHQEAFPNNLLRYMVFGVNACLIVFFCARFGKLNEQKKIVKTAILIGDASYSIYLSHVFLLACLTNIMRPVFLHLHFTNWQATMVYCLLLTAVVFSGILLHLYVEKPVLHFLQDRLIEKRKPSLNPVAK